MKRTNKQVTLLMQITSPTVPSIWDTGKTTLSQVLLIIMPNAIRFFKLRQLQIEIYLQSPGRNNQRIFRLPRDIPLVYPNTVEILCLFSSGRLATVADRLWTSAWGVTLKV